MREFRKVVQRVIEYIPSGFEDEKKPLTFMLRTLTQRELAQIADQSSRLDIATNQMVLGTSELEYETARKTIIGWDNFIVEGKELKFVQDYDGYFVESIILELDIFDVLTEVGRHIITTSKLPE